MSRIGYVTADDAPAEIREALDGSAYADAEDRHLFYEMLANVPSVFQHRVDYFSELMRGGELPKREKELAYLTVAFVTNTRFVAAAHARYLVDDHDVSSETITALGTGDLSGLSERDRAIVTFARQVVRDPSDVDDDAFDGLRTVGLNDSELMELLLLTCEAHSATTIVTSTGMKLSDRGETEPAYLPDEFAL
jgi:uncharacterized peroxidase-related enzyme